MADLIQEYEARIAALERLVGKQALELEFLKGAVRQGRRPRSGRPWHVHRRRTPADAGGAPSAGLGREPQEAEAADARAQPHPPRRRRFVATTDSDHDLLIFPHRRDELVVDGPNQLWVADLTDVAIVAGFVYVALIMDAWSQRIVGYAIGRRIDARLTLAALDATIVHRQPPEGCLHHSDRGSQYAARRYRDRLADAQLVGSLWRLLAPVPAESD